MSYHSSRKVGASVEAWRCLRLERGLLDEVGQPSLAGRLIHCKGTVTRFEVRAEEVLRRGTRPCGRDSISERYGGVVARKNCRVFRERRAAALGVESGRANSPCLPLSAA